MGHVVDGREGELVRKTVEGIALLQAVLLSQQC
jgi:hypothetical protein